MCYSYLRPFETWDRENKRRNRETVGIEITCCFNPTGIENTEKQKGMTFDYTTVKKMESFREV